MPMQQLPPNFELIPTNLEQAKDGRNAKYKDVVIQRGDPIALFEYEQVVFDKSANRGTKITSTRFMESGEYKLIVLSAATAKKELHDIISSLDPDTREAYRPRLVFVSTESADELYDMVMSEIRNASWFKPELHEKPNILVTLGIKLISDISCAFINGGLGLAIDQKINSQSRITGRKAQIEVKDGYAVAVTYEQHISKNHDLNHILQCSSDEDESNLEASEVSYKKARVTSECSLIPSSIAEVTDPSRKVLFNRRVIESGQRIPNFEFASYYYGESRDPEIRIESTKFFEKGNHCIITLPGKRVTVENLYYDPHLQSYIDILEALNDKFDSLVVVGRADIANLYKQVLDAVARAPWFNSTQYRNAADAVRKLKITVIPDINAAFINDALGFATDGKYGITCKRGFVVVINGVAKSVFFENDPTIAAHVRPEDALRAISSLKLTPKDPTTLYGERPKEKFIIVGGGMVGAMHALVAYMLARKNGQRLRVTVYEKNSHLQQTTIANIIPSLTLDELLSVIPRGQDLVQALGVSFKDLKGISISDVINNSHIAIKFKEQVLADAKDEGAYRSRTYALLQLGKLSMDLWKEIYDTADARLKQILDDSNFHPSYEPDDADNKLGNGYRIDLIYATPNAREKAESMRQDYMGVGYKKCRTLTPDETEEMDPSQAEFCKNNSEMSEGGARVWKNSAVALYRPGGCLDAQKFLPQLYEYLKDVMGKYTNECGDEKDCFRIKFKREVDGLVLGTGLSEDDQNTVHGLRFKARRNQPAYTKIDSRYKSKNYLLVTGENVGLMSKLGCAEPAYAVFGGASLKLNIELSSELAAKYKSFSHWKEVHRPGVVLAWQAHCLDGKFYVGVAGTKAFHGDQGPTKDDAFALHRGLLQLNIINDVFPDVLSDVLKKNTSEELTEDDLRFLESQGIARRWVGRRAVYFDGAPLTGSLYMPVKNDGINECPREPVKFTNLFGSSGWGSGGGSNAPGAALLTFAFNNNLGKSKKPFNSPIADTLLKDLAALTDSRRCAAYQL